MSSNAQTEEFTNEKRAEMMQEIADAIKKVHNDEFPELIGGGKGDDPLPLMSYPRLCLHVLITYVYFTFKNWSWTLWNIFTLPMAPLDVISQFYWAVCSQAILFAMGVSCLFMREPTIAKMYTSWSNKNANGLSLINAAEPDMFTMLPKEQYAISRATLSRPIKKSKDNNYQRVFNLDIAKMLLLCASLMYERVEHPKAKVLKELSEMAKKTRVEHHTQPTPSEGPRTLKSGEAFDRIFSSKEEADVVRAQLDSESDVAVIKQYAKLMGLEFHVLSELNSRGTSATGLFYSPDDNFIILAFKGTSASEFDEWETDCNFRAVEGGSWLRGFGNIQKGFMDRMFPSTLTQDARMPFDSISVGVQAVTDIMARHRPRGTKINVYFTGHSLGCAMASLAYCRANMEPNELGTHAQIRDGYIFAAPLMCDNQSVNSFNNIMHHGPKDPRTLWRITQGRDLVATGLPSWGDTPDRRLSPFNMFGYAHLGTELTMKSPPQKPLVSGNNLVSGSDIVLHSAFTEALSDPRMEKPNALRVIFGVLSWVPFVSRIVDHCTFMYFDELCRLKNGEAKWDVSTWSTR